MSEIFKPTQERIANPFNLSELVNFRKVSAFPNNEMIDPESRLARLKNESEISTSAESQTNSLESQAKSYLLSQNLEITFTLNNALKREIGCHIILQIKPTDKSQMVQITRLCNALFRQNIYTIADLSKFLHELNYIKGVGHVYKQHLNQILANYRPESDTKKDDI
jgi:hypothetical protein